MLNDHQLSPALRGKSLAEQIRLIQAIRGAGRSGRFPLELADNKVLVEFIMKTKQGRIVDDALLLAVSSIVRHYEQHLIALTRSVR